MKVLRFREWLLKEEQGELQARAILNRFSPNDSSDQLINLFRTFVSEDKYWPILAWIYENTKGQNFNIQDFIKKYKDLVDSNKLGMVTIGRNLEASINKNPISFNAFKDYVLNLHQQKTYLNQTTENEPNSKLIFNNNGIKIFFSPSRKACIDLGKGSNFCISAPGNTHWQSYRDLKTSTFYFIFDENRPENDPLHMVVADANKAKIELTDTNNTTGTIAEFGKNVEMYLKYLQSKGVPPEIFKHVAKTPQEQEEYEQLGQENKDLEWFKNLDFGKKSRYIGKGNLLSNEQFKFIWDNNLDHLINQYVSTGISLDDEQTNKILNSKYKKTFLHHRFNANQQNPDGTDLKAQEFYAMSPEQQEKSPPKTLYKVATEKGDLNLLKEAFKKGFKPTRTDYSEGLSNAAALGNIEILKFIISKEEHFPEGSDEFSKEYAIENAAGVAIDNGQKEAAIFLVDHGADLGLSLFVAFHTKFQDIVLALIARDENIEYTANNYLIHAAKAGFLKVINFLISQGANKFKEAIAAAKAAGHPEVVDFLQKRQNM
jgi:hypothetical protein